MPILNFIINVFCYIDDKYKKSFTSLKKGGFTPVLSDSEVITIEIVGEFLSIDTDKGLWSYFKKHWQELFPKLGDRTCFLRQAANLYQVKRVLYEQAVKDLGAFSDQLHMIDGFPMPTCQFARAHFSKLFKGEAAYGYCATKQDKFKSRQ